MNFKIFKIIVYIFIGIAMIWLFLYSPTEINEDSGIYLASVDSLIDDTTTEMGGQTVRTIRYNGTIIDKQLPEQTFIIEDTFSIDQPYHIFAEPGDKILAYLDYEDDGSTIKVGRIVKFVRTQHLIIILAIFLVLLVLVGGFQGVKAVVSLGMTLLMVFKVILPRILAGDNAVVVSVIATIVITVFTLLIISGFNKKSYAAMLGTIAGVTIGGGIAIWISSQAKILGLSFEEAQFIQFISDGVDLDFSGLLFASILLGALGAVMDVCMSIASSIEEIKQASPFISNKELFFSGMHVGRDVMGTMVNTLILAYAGSSMLLLMMYMGYGIPFIQIINDDLILTELVRALAGTIGLVAAIPITALIAASFTASDQY